MSALEDLIARFQQELRLTLGEEPERWELRQVEGEAMNLYNRIAHELAERIRETVSDLYDPGEEGVCPLDAIQAANLIDPAVE